MHFLECSVAHASTAYAVATDFPGKDIGDKVNSAISSLGVNGGTVYIPPGDYSFSTAIQFSAVLSGINPGGANISILGGGRNATVLRYTGKAQSIKCTNPGGGANSPSSGGLSNFTLIGTNAPSSVGIYIQSCTGVHLDHLSVNNFGAAGVEFDNIHTTDGAAWTERTYIEDLVAYNNPPSAPDIWFHVSGGTNSFGYTTIVGSHLDGQALLVDAGAALYGSFIQFNSNSGGVAMIDVRGSVASSLFDVHAENTGGAPNSYSVVVERGGSFFAQGMVRAEGMSVQIKNGGTFYLFGQGVHGDPAASSAGTYPGDQVTRPIAADDQTGPAAILAMSGYPALGTGNVLVMTAPSSDGRGGLRVLNGLNAASSVVGSIDNSGVLKLMTTAHPSAAQPGQVAFTSLTSTTAQSGNASSPPPKVAGYLIVNIGGTNYKIPYYAN
jgi:hypothetical protein